MLHGYRALQSVMCAQNTTQPEVQDASNVLCKHFPELTPRFIAIYLVNAADDCQNLKLKEIDRIEQILTEIGQALASSCSDAAEALSADEVFDLCLTDFDQTNFSGLLMAAAGFPADNLEKQIAFGDWEKVSALLSAPAQRCALNMTDEECAQLLEAVAGQDPSKPADLSFYQAGRRLYDLLGNRNRTAEKFFLAGLKGHMSQCLPLLLEIYRSCEAKKQFSALCFQFEKGCALSEENLRYLLNALADQGDDQLQTYLKNHGYLLYFPQSLQIVLDCGEAALAPGQHEALAARMEIFAAHPSYSALEEAVISNDQQALSDAISSLEKGDSSEYAPEEIARLQTALPSDYPLGSSDFDVGTRLYLFQKNKYRTAETFLRKALSQNAASSCDLLLTMLAEETRWQECLELCEAYPELCTSAEAVGLIALAAVCCTPEAAPAFIRGNLQHCLRLLCDREQDFGAMLREKVDELCRHECAETARFFQELIKLQSPLENTLVHAAALQTPALRELVTHPDTLSALGMTPSAADRLHQNFITNQYSRASTAGGVAQRLYSLLGTYGSAAKLFCEFALPYDDSMAVLLWEIMQEAGDSAAQYDLLVKYPALQEKHPAEYRLLLLQNHAYQQLIDQFGPGGSPDTLTKLQLALAQVRTGAPWNDILEDDSLDLTEIAPEWIRELLAALAELGGDAAAMFLTAHFDAMLSVYSAEQLQQITSAEGLLDREMLCAIQHYAQDKNIPLALYCCNIRDAGEMTAQMTAWVEAQAQQMETKPFPQQLDALNVLQKVLANTPGGLLEDLTFRVIRTLASVCSTDALDALFLLLHDIRLSSSTLHQVLKLLEEKAVRRTEFSLDRRRSLYAVIETTGQLDPECIRFFHDALTAGQYAQGAKASEFLCAVYADAFRLNIFPEARLEAAETACLKILENRWSDAAVYCLYHIETALGNTSHAQFALLLLQKCTDEAIFPLISTLRQDDLSSLYALFCSAMQASPKQAKAFVTFCEALCKKLPETFAADTEEDLPEEDALEGRWSALLYALFRNPEDRDKWQELEEAPLKDEPEIFSRVLYLCSIKIFWEKDLRSKCVDYFEHYTREDDLLELLLEYANSSNTGNVLTDFLDKLGGKARHDSGYFAGWSGLPQLTELMDILCRKTAELAELQRSRIEAGEQDAAHYHNLKNLSIIVVTSGSAEALRFMWKYRLMEAYYLRDYVDLGVTMVCRLLLAARIPEAAELIRLLSRSLTDPKAKNLIASLVGLSEQELTEWAGSEVNRQLLGLILPAGNQPDIDAINDLLLRCSLDDAQASVGAQVLYALLQVFPNDFGAYNGLRILCKKNIDNKLPLLHFALQGLIRTHASLPPDDMASLYPRPCAEYGSMLARINAVILATGKVGEVCLYTDYDFDTTAGSYYSKHRPGEDNAARVMSRLQDETQTLFVNRSSNEIAVLAEGIICSVTEHWTSYLKNRWAARTPAKDILANITVPNSNLLLRSALHVTCALEGNQRESFANWITAAVPDTSNENEFGRVYDRLLNEFSKVSTELIDGYFFDYPTEEISLFDPICERTVRQIVSKAPGQVYPIATLTGHLANNPFSHLSLFEWAKNAFEKGKDTAAFDYLAALRDLDRDGVFSMEAPSVPQSNAKKPDFRRRPPLQEWKAFHRLAGLFANVDDITKIVSSVDFPVWSCINLMLALLSTERADEAQRLMDWLSPANQEICSILLQLSDSKGSDIAKLNAIESCKDPIAKGFLCFIAIYGSKRNQASPSVLVSDPVIVNNLKQLYSSLFEKEEAMHKRENPFNAHTMLYSIIPRIKRDKILLQPKASAAAPVSPTAAAPAEYTAVVALPSFAASLEGTPPEGKTVDELIRQCESCIDTMNHSACYEAAQQLYLLSQSTSERQEEALLYLGIAHYSYMKVENASSDAIHGLKELMNRSLENVVNASVYKHLSALVRGGRLKELLSQGYSGKGLPELLKDFRRFSLAFENMKRMLGDSRQLDCIDQIYPELEKLAQVYSVSVGSDPSLRLAELQRVYDSLGAGNENDQWVIGVKSAIRGLISREQHSLNSRPNLSIKVLNQGKCGEIGRLFGVVRNDGRAAATDIVIRAHYGNGTLSKQYRLDKLAPERSAAFAVAYIAAQGAEALEYELEISYRFGEEHLSLQTERASIGITAEKPPEIPENLYDTRTVMGFRVDENGEVFSPEFYGRNHEKDRVADLFRDNVFFEYKNALIRGIKRSGKSSLLHYIKTYAQVHCPDALVIIVDCQAVTTNIMHTVFVQKVLEEIASTYPEVKKELAADLSDLGSATGWDAFAAGWNAKQTDFESGELQSFYLALKEQLGGKGLILILDEVDKAFSELHPSDFNTLRALLGSEACRSAIHLILCGSNNLIRLERDIAPLSQLFQEFAGNVIPVGHMGKDDLYEMLQAPCAKKCPHVVYTEDALKTILDCTGGFVWYTKLLCNAILKRVAVDNRSVIYPTDVYNSLYTILEDQNFKQIVGGNKKELLVMDALQSQTGSATQCVSAETIQATIGPELSLEEVEKILNDLIHLQLIRRSNSNKFSSGHGYGFAVTLYWHYFRQRESRFKRVPEIARQFEEIVSEAPVSSLSSSEDY